MLKRLPAVVVLAALLFGCPTSAEAASIEVLIADDKRLTRSGLKAILGSEPDIEVVGEARDGGEAVEEATRLKPGVVLIDVAIPDGVEATRRLCSLDAAKCPRVLVVSSFVDDECVYECLRAGVTGFLLKEASPQELREGIRTVARGKILLASPVAHRLIEHFTRLPKARIIPSKMEALSCRELEVLRLVARGLSNSEIAATMELSVSTVKTHVAHVLHKLELRDRTQAVVTAYEAGVVTPAED